MTEMTPEDDLLESAWVLIANVSEGNWARETPEWEQAAERWRDSYHDLLTKRMKQAENDPELQAIVEWLDRFKFEAINDFGMTDSTAAYRSPEENADDLLAKLREARGES